MSDISLDLSVFLVHDLPPVLHGINDTPFNRFAHKSPRMVSPQCGDVLFLTNKLCVKYGDLVQISEAFTMQFITSHTSIPLPKVYCAFVHKGCTYIMMERIGGKMLAREWYRDSRPVDSRERIFAQLRMMLNEISSLPAPCSAVANMLGGPVYDPWFLGTSLTIGPFQTIYNFRLFLHNGMLDLSPDRHYPDICDMT